MCLLASIQETGTRVVTQFTFTGNLDNIQWPVEDREARRVQYAINELLPIVTYGDNEFKTLESDVCVVCLNGYMDSECCGILPSCKNMFLSCCIAAS